MDVCPSLHFVALFLYYDILNYVKYLVYWLYSMFTHSLLRYFLCTVLKTVHTPVA